MHTQQLLCLEDSSEWIALDFGWVYLEDRFVVEFGRQFPEDMFERLFLEDKFALEKILGWLFLVDIVAQSSLAGTLEWVFLEDKPALASTLGMLFRREKIGWSFLGRKLVQWFLTDTLAWWFLQDTHIP